MREVGEACRKHEHPRMLPKVARWLPRTWCEGRRDIHTFRHEPFDSSGYAGSALWKLSWQLEAKGTRVGEGTETHGTTASMRVQLPQWTRGIPGSCAQSSDRGSIAAVESPGRPWSRALPVAGARVALSASMLSGCAHDRRVGTHRATAPPRHLGLGARGWARLPRDPDPGVPRQRAASATLKPMSACFMTRGCSRAFAVRGR
jgi:hypothetical protein